jgi:hypothetical protein
MIALAFLLALAWLASTPAWPLAFVILFVAGTRE